LTLEYAGLAEDAKAEPAPETERASKEECPEKEPLPGRHVRSLKASLGQSCEVISLGEPEGEVQKIISGEFWPYLTLDDLCRDVPEGRTHTSGCQKGNEVVISRLSDLLRALRAGELIEGPWSVGADLGQHLGCGQIDIAAVGTGCLDGCHGCPIGR
jgi:hypothetical protein